MIEAIDPEGICLDPEGYNGLVRSGRYVLCRSGMKIR